MAVPAHDERDEFAKKYGIPIREVISPTGKISAEIKEALQAKAKWLICRFDGMDSVEGIKEIIKFVNENNIGNAEINYKLKLADKQTEILYARFRSFIARNAARYPCLKKICL